MPSSKDEVRVFDRGEDSEESDDNVVDAKSVAVVETRPTEPQPVVTNDSWGAKK
jgi:hypothetical protein